MHNLKQHIDEALFSKDGINTKQAGDALKLEMFKQYCPSFFTKDVNTTIKNGEMYVEIDQKSNGDVTLTIEKETPASLFPLNIKQIAGHVKYWLIYVASPHITSISEVFCDDFVEDVKTAENDAGPVFVIEGCRKLKDLKNCPKRVFRFQLDRTSPNVESLDGMPSWIQLNAEYYLKESKSQIFLSNTSWSSKKQLENLISPRSHTEDEIKNNIRSVVNFYHHLDKNCPLAQALEKNLHDVCGIRI